MMIQVRLEEAEGKTIKTVSQGDEGQALIVYTDDTFTFLQPEGNEDDGYELEEPDFVKWFNQYTIMEQDIVEAGVMTREQMDARNRELQQSIEDALRRQYEQLKEKFEK